MAARQERIDAFIHEGSPPADRPLEILCEDHLGTYVIPFLCQWTEGHLAKRENTPTYRSCGDRLAGSKTKSALNLEVLSRSFAPMRDFLVIRRPAPRRTINIPQGEMVAIPNLNSCQLRDYGAGPAVLVSNILARISWLSAMNCSSVNTLRRRR